MIDSNDESILLSLGHRLERHRLSRNLTQAQVAEEAGVSRRTVERLEAGEGGQLTSLLRVLRVLELLDGLDRMVPELPPSPIEQLRMRSRVRLRASSSRREDADTPWVWGDDR